MILKTPAQVVKWVNLWNNRPFGADKPPSAPAYVKGYGALVAGLMQSRPPVATFNGKDDPPLTSDDLGSLVDDLVPPAAGMGAAYMRPVPDGDDGWVLSVETPSNVVPVWRNHKLVKAYLWTAVPIAASTERLALVEEWDNQTGNVEVTIRTVDVNGVTTVVSPTKAKLRVGPEHQALVDSWIEAVENQSTVERRIVPFVWKFVNHLPAPIYDGSEGLVEGLVRLNDQEQDDGEMARHRLIIDDDLVSYEQYQDPATNTLSRRQQTFTLKDNLLRVNRGQMTAQAADSSDLIKPVTFPDSLVQRDRIERRENSALEAIGINPQSVGRSVSGRSDSAAAKRADQQMTVQTVSGPARNLTIALQDAITQLAELNEGWPELETVTIYEGLKPDTAEAAETADTLQKASAASTRTLVETAHPTWTKQQVNEELQLMALEGLPVAEFVREQT